MFNLIWCLDLGFFQQAVINNLLEMVFYSLFERNVRYAQGWLTVRVVEFDTDAGIFSYIFSGEAKHRRDEPEEEFGNFPLRKGVGISEMLPQYLCNVP